MKPEITYDIFSQVDLRVGTILTAERVPKSNKLLKLQVSFGDFERQILAGIGSPNIGYVPETLPGRQLLFVVNLAPRMMMGFESHGMVLAVPGEGGTLGVLSSNLTVPDGASAG